MAVAALTSKQSRMIRDYIPSLSQGHPPSFDIAAKLDAIIALLNTSETGLDGVLASLLLIKSGTAIIVNTANSVDVTLTGLGGKPAIAIMGEADGVKTIRTCIWAGDVLTITASAAMAADRDVYYIVDGR